jgi:hypothetical protein
MTKKNSLKRLRRARKSRCIDMEELTMRTKKHYRTVIALAALSVPLSFGALPAWANDVQDPAGIAAERLGTIHFPVSCNATAQEAFDRAMPRAPASRSSAWEACGRR